MERDRGWTLGGLIGGTWGIKQHGNRLGEWVGVGVLMVEVVGVNMLAGWRRWNVCWQRWGGRRGRQLKGHRKAALVLQRKWRWVDGMA